MNASETLKNHMDAVRSVTTTSDKLSIRDATSMLKAPQKAGVFLLDASNTNANQAGYRQNGDAYRFTSLVDGINVGVYLSYPSEMKQGSYVFECLIRGNFVLNRIGNEASGLIFEDIPLDEKDWKLFRVPFQCTPNSVFNLYGKATKDQWLEINHPYYIEMGDD